MLRRRSKSSFSSPFSSSSFGASALALHLLSASQELKRDEGQQQQPQRLHWSWLQRLRARVVRLLLRLLQAPHLASSSVHTEGISNSQRRTAERKTRLVTIKQAKLLFTEAAEAAHLFWHHKYLTSTPLHSASSLYPNSLKLSSEEDSFD